jgi:hypothetical protein
VPMTEFATKFACPNCAAEYKLVREKLHKCMTGS